MGIASRIIGAIVTAAVSYAIYVYLPPFLLDFVSGDGITFGDLASITIGSFEDLVNYITALGYIIVGTAFAAGVSPKKTWIKAVWSILQFVLSLCFWGIFLFMDFNTINVSAVFMTGGLISLDLDITIMFWVMMGGNIFALVIAILDLGISFLPKEEGTSSKPKKEKASKSMEAEPKLKVTERATSTNTMEIHDLDAERPTAPKPPSADGTVDDFFNKSMDDMK